MLLLKLLRNRKMVNTDKMMTRSRHNDFTEWLSQSPLIYMYV